VRRHPAAGRDPLRAIATALALILAACSGGRGVTPPTAPSETLVARLRTPHFVLQAGLATDERLRAIGAALEATYDRVTAELETGDVGTLTVEVWQDEASFVAALESYFGRRYASTGYVTGPATLRVLVVPRVEVNASHELCHALSMRVNPTIANNPRWLWETVALYENGERVDPRSIPYLAAGRFPTLSALDADPDASRQVYEVGYLIGEFVVFRAGREGLLRLVRANGDVGVIGFASPRAFEEAWAGFVRDRYF
jgi:hypothetical protein